MMMLVLLVISSLGDSSINLSPSAPADFIVEMAASRKQKKLLICGVIYLPTFETLDVINVDRILFFKEVDYHSTPNKMTTKQ